MGVLTGVKPVEVFQYFEEICQIPHGSGDMKAISAYVEEVLKAHHISYRKDESCNIIAWKAAAPGYEDAAAVMLQGHMDMVNEKITDSNHDFSCEPLDLFIDGDFIGAKDTTLGGDDGIAVAFMLAILTDTTLLHPALECVFTIDEEVGLLGAKAINLSDCKASYMINLDSEDEGVFLTSCAGGIRVDLNLPIEKEDGKGNFYEIIIDDCLGGHSGAEIHKERCNPLLLSGRMLFDFGEAGMDYRLASLDGGQKDNAIPRSVRIVLAADVSFEEMKETAVRIFNGYKKEYAVSDPYMTISVKECEQAPVMTLVSQVKVTFLLCMMPSGVQAMSQDIPGLVETSLNTGIMRTEEDSFYLGQSIRSSINARKVELVNKLTFLIEYLGGEADTRGDYPGWEYKQDSVLRPLMAEVWEETTGKPARIEAIHAGLECGLISEKMPGIDIVSMGPDMKAIHTPNERLSISSCERCYHFLLEVLKRMKG